MLKPSSIETFQNQVNKLKEERRKGENVLVDEVERDIEQKEKFISEQIRTLQEMQ